MGMEKDEALMLIYDDLKNGYRYGRIIDRVRFPYFETVLCPIQDKRGEYIKWRHYGESACDMTIQNLQWVLDKIFEKTPEEFLEEYEVVDDIREYFIRQTLGLTYDGFRVFINKQDPFDGLDFNYALVSDGSGVVYFQYNREVEKVEYMYQFLRTTSDGWDESETRDYDTADTDLSDINAKTIRKCLEYGRAYCDLGVAIGRRPMRDINEYFEATGLDIKKFYREVIREGAL